MQGGGGRRVSFRSVCESEREECALLLATGLLRGAVWFGQMLGWFKSTGRERAGFWLGPGLWGEDRETASMDRNERERDAMRCNATREKMRLYAAGRTERGRGV